jgi:hypothetical protein
VKGVGPGSAGPLLVAAGGFFSVFEAFFGVALPPI